MLKKKYEPWIRVHGEMDSSIYLEMACGYGWDKRGCFEAIESYCVLIDKEKRAGKIIMAEYNFGPYEFKEIGNFEDCAIVTIPNSLIKSAKEDYIGLPDKIFSQLNDAQKMFCIHRAMDFKPMNLEDFDFVRRNCY